MTKKKPRGRPPTSTPELKREQARARKRRFDRKQKLIKAISEKLLSVDRKHREVWLEYLAWAHDCGENLLVGVEWEHGGGTRTFEQLSDLLLSGESDKGELVSIEFI